jgi:signal transduction histidine kinase
MIRAARRNAPLLVTASPLVQSDSVRLLLLPVRGWPGWLLVLGASLRQRDVAVAGVRQGLVLGGLIAIVLIAAGAYILARVALGPVERLRRQAAALAEMEPGASLEEPHTHDEIARLASTLNLLLAKVRSSLARQRRLVADASHELRTPLAILHGELQLADRPGRSRAELVAAVHNAASETRRLVHLGEDLLFLSRSDERSLAISPSDTDVAELLRHVAEAHRQAGESRGVTLAVEVEDTLIAHVDESHIRRALHNLVYNALRFSPQGTSVGLAASVARPGVASATSATSTSGGQPPAGPRGLRQKIGLHKRRPEPDDAPQPGRPTREVITTDSLVIEVTDEGLGFPADLLPHAFERFRRSGDSRSRSGDSDSGSGAGGSGSGTGSGTTGGAGLGLAIVQAIAQAHGGYCTAANRQPTGACVRMIIPLPSLSD